MSLYRRHAKRLFDLALTVAVSVVLLPVMGVLALLIRCYLGSPVLFRQTRPGLHGLPFELIKFRTMTDARDENGNLLPNAQRMTRFGRFLRSTSLDELPELWNVIKGDMSLVGPRPLLMDYLPYYTERMARRHAVRPGLTGWVQVKGRNALDWESKFELDIWYVENQSFTLDLKILFLTLGKVLRREGIAHPGDVAMPRFDLYMENKRKADRS